MQAIISDIQNKLSSEVVNLKYIDEDWGQLDYYSPNFPVKFPCVLIDILSVQWTNLGNKQQQGLAQVRLKIADMRLSNSSKAAPTGQKNNSNSFYILTQNIYKALHTFSNKKELYSGLIREGEKRVQRDDGLKMNEMIFTTQITDISASIVLEKTDKPTVVFNTGLIENS